MEGGGQLATAALTGSGPRLLPESDLREPPAPIVLPSASTLQSGVAPVLAPFLPTAWSTWKLCMLASQSAAAQLQPQPLDVGGQGPLFHVLHGCRRN